MLSLYVSERSRLLNESLKCYAFSVFGCSNDELEQFSTNATIDVFESSRRVTYTCPGDEYELVGPGIVVCDASGWIGNPGNCHPKGVGKLTAR